MKQEFEMLQSEMDDILQINKDQMPVMMIGGITTGMDLRERINRYWLGLGEKYGFKHLTVEGSAKGKLFFLAEPAPIIPPKTAAEIAMDKYDTIKKIVEAIEAGSFVGKTGSINSFIPFMALKRMI